MVEKHAHSLTVGVLRWTEQDGIARMIGEAVASLGHRVIYFYESAVPDALDVIFTFGPYGCILPVWHRIAVRDGPTQPRVIHWNTEGLPDLRIPIQVMRLIGWVRSALGRFLRMQDSRIQRALLPVSWLERRRMIRYRNFGDYAYAYKRGWVTTLADSSQMYRTIHKKRGIPAEYLPWGSSPGNFADLKLERDLDVLWMGKHGSSRRWKIIDQVRAELKAQGVEIYMADNIENPYIFGDRRTEFLNRAKITLNITRTWYDDNYSRFALAAPNRSLLVSEPLLPHCPDWRPQVHYVSAPVEDLSKIILHYLENDEERQRIVENAYDLVTTDLCFSKWVQQLLQGAVQQNHFEWKANRGGAHRACQSASGRSREKYEF